MHLLHAEIRYFLGVEAPNDCPGTTGAGLAAGCPTMAVPFFGDQAFWGEMCRRSGVGPAPVPVERLSVEALLEGLAFLARPEVRARHRGKATVDDEAGKFHS